MFNFADGADVNMHVLFQGKSTHAFQLMIAISAQYHGSMRLMLQEKGEAHCHIRLVRDE